MSYLLDSNVWIGLLRQSSAVLADRFRAMAPTADIRMTCLIGTARWLADHRDRWSGTVLLIAQPAEEAIDGAKDMLKAGLYTRFPKPQYALAPHCASDVPVGSVASVSGPTLASSTSLLVTIRGKGGHGAWPHSAHFAPEPAAAIDTGVRAMTAAVVRLLPPKRP